MNVHCSHFHKKYCTRTILEVLYKYKSSTIFEVLYEYFEVIRTCLSREYCTLQNTRTVHVRLTIRTITRYD